MGFALGFCFDVAFAQPANEPLEKFVVTDGTIYATVKSSNILYFGGAFSLVGVRSGGGVPVSADIGVAEATYPMVNGDVYTAINDGNGGWFVGGSFTEVGGFIRTNLVHIKANRTVDANWNPSAVGSAVYSMALAGGTLYFGGDFTNVNGLVRNRAAAVDSVSAEPTGWNPNVNGNIKAVSLYGTNVYLGGEFTSAGGQTRNYLAVVDNATGLPGAWNPGASASVEAMVMNGGHLYVGGYFTAAGGQSRGCGASFDLSTGNLDPWNPNLTGLGLVIPEIFAMDAWQNTIFVGGLFGTAGTSNRVNAAALDATTGIATDWDARQVVTITSGIPSGQVSSLAVYGNALYVGGILVDIGGQPRGCAAALDLVTGDAKAWDPKVNQPAQTFCGSGDTIFLGGRFGALNCVQRTNLAAYDIASNQVTAWNPGLITSSAPGVLAMTVASNQVFVGGYYTNIAGVSRYSLAALNPVSGSALPWNPNPAPSTIYSFGTWSNRLFVGGTFSSMGGSARTNFAEFDLGTGLVTSWDPAIRLFVQTMVVNSNTLFVGGLFSTASGQARRRVASFDLTSDTLTSWNPSITSGTYVDGLAASGNTVYMVGSFTAVNSVGRVNFAAVDAVSGNVLPISADTDSFVYTVAATSNLVFIGGNFQNVSSQPRRFLAALDARTGVLTSWNSPADLFVKRMDIFDNSLYVAGAFGHLAGASTRSIGAYPLSLTGAPGIVPNSVQRSPNGNFQFRLTAGGVPQATVQVSSDLVTWQPLQSVPLIGGYGVFTDTNIPNAPQRFYRISVP